ncbi:MAG: hypothetical protein ABI743_11725 [bacterium]
MDVRYRIDSITLAAVPELDHRCRRPATARGTLGGGQVLWQGGQRESIVLTGAGLTEDERSALLTLIAAGVPVEWDDGVATMTVMVTELNVEPIVGTVLYQYRLTLVVLA